MSGSPSTSTTTSNNAPPAEFLQAYQGVNNQAQNVAATPYQSYQGNTIAPFAPGQVQGMQQVQDLTANGGVQAPYLDAAARSLLNAQTPLIQNIPTLSDPVLQGQAYNAIQNFAGAAGPDIQNAASQGAQNIMNASKAFNPNSIQPWESPYTQDVVNATQNQFNNANAIQQQQVIGDAIGKGAWGGDRSAVAQALTAGQQQLAQAPVIAGLYNTGYQNATQAAQTAANMGLQGSTSAGSLGLQGAAQQAAARQAAGQAQQGIFSGQQQTELGANEANAWLASQAGALFGNLGQEAQTLGLQGANANLGIGGMQQGMGQSLLNVPYEQNLAAQAYPFQTTGWLANIAEGLGGASGGNSSTTVPGPSTASQVAGLGLGAAGVAGQAGAFKGLGNSISNAFSSGANSVPAAGTDAYAAYLNSGAARGGTVPQRAPGGSVPDVSLSVIPQATGLGASPIVAPMSPDAIVPGASGMGAAPKTHGTMDILKNYGQTASTVGPKQDSTFGSLLKTAGAIAAGIYGGPAGGMAASELNKQYTLATGGTVPKRASGGMSPSMESPWWERSAASNMTRHGLLSSPVAGRTDQLAISPAAGSYVVPADVVSGLGEGNTLAGANIMQRILDTGPHGLKMPVSSHNHMGPPRPPPAYNEGTEHISNTSHYVPNAKGGSVGRASGGAANDNPKYSREELLGSGLSRVIDNAGDDQDLADIKHSVLHHGLHVPASLFDVPDRASGGMIPRRAVGGYTSLQDFINRGSSNNDSGRAPAQINFENQGVGINASTGTGGSHTGMPALDNYLNNVEMGANFTRPTTGAPAAAPAAPGPTTPPATTKGPPNGNFETNAYSNASPFLQAFANDLASNPQANPQYKTFFAEQMNNGGGGMASGGMIPRRADGGSLGSDPGDDVIDLAVDSTPVPPVPPAMEGTPAAVGMAPPGATVAQAAALRSNATDIPAAPARMRDTGEPMAQGSGLHRAQADPWLALAEAGFGMAAGKSPHALENIGAGANEGVKRYIQQKQEANKENLQADIWGGKLGVQQQRADEYGRVSEARIPLLQAQALKYTQQASSGGKPETFKYAGDNDDGLPIFVGNHGTQKLGDIAIGLTANQRSLEAGRTAQNETRQAGLALRAQQIQNTDAYRQASLALRAKLGDNANTNAILSRATTLAAATGMPMEKATAQVLAQQPRVKAALPSVTAPRSAPTSPPPSGAPPLSEILGP